MGQSSSCGDLQNIINNQKQIRTISNTRESMNPLQKIHPVTPNLDQPTQMLQLQNKSNYTNQRQPQKENIICEDVVNIQQSPDMQNQIILKKIEVKWNKFIKIKRKNFMLDYNVIKEIGRGGFGCVYKVVMKNGNICRAAKKIQKNKLKQIEHQNLLAQMAIMMHMDHPNITKLYEVYEQYNKYILILQLCEGGELFQKIVQRSITQNQAKSIMKQVLSALNYMHTKGIVHRDIKPQNMLFQRNTKLIKIIDFGISTKKQPHTYLTTSLGTPYYIAPQVLDKKYNEKCDIWSLGIVMYMIIYGSPPFRGDTPVKVMSSIKKDEIMYKNPKHYNFSSQALEFLQQLLIKNPKKRPSASEALQSNWLNVKKPYKTNKIIQEQKDKILERIKNFHFKNKLEAVVYTYIVSQLLTSEQRLQILQIFRQLDKNNNGIIEICQLKEALADKQKYKISNQKIKLIRDYVDTNCSGSIDYTQFLVAALDFKTKITDKHFQQAFAYFDIDGSGEITFYEVSKFLETQITTQDQIKMMFKQVDKNGDGVISKTEFVLLLAMRKLEKVS